MYKKMAKTQNTISEFVLFQLYLAPIKRPTNVKRKVQLSNPVKANVDVNFY